MGNDANAVNDGHDQLEFRYAPRADITEEELERLRPYLNRRTIPAVTYYAMESEARHLLVGSAMAELTWSN